MMKGARLAPLLAALTTLCVLASCGWTSERTTPDEQPSTAVTTTVTSSPSPSTSPAAKTPTSTSRATPKDTLKGDTRNAIAYAPLDDPTDVTVVGSVPSSRAWSTSKVLIVCAFINTVAGGDPEQLSADQRSLITKALTASDMNALITVRSAIPGGAQRPITEILRSIGDTTTQVPAAKEGVMQWGIRDQVRFMAALADGEVVSPATSRYVLKTMRPIPQHRWGLGTIGASAFKGGWLTPQTETRQMGIVDGYAVAIITAGDGPAVLQTDGDSAHVQQMNHLASILQGRLDAEQESR